MVKRKGLSIFLKKAPSLSDSIVLTSWAKPVFRLFFPPWWSQWKWHLPSCLGHGALRVWWVFDAMGILWGVYVNFPVCLSRRLWLVGDSWIYMHISTFSTISSWRFIQHKYYLNSAPAVVWLCAGWWEGRSELWHPTIAIPRYNSHFCGLFPHKGWIWIWKCWCCSVVLLCALGC